MPSRILCTGSGGSFCEGALQIIYGDTSFLALAEVIIQRMNTFANHVRARSVEFFHTILDFLNNFLIGSKLDVIIHRLFCFRTRLFPYLYN